MKALDEEDSEAAFQEAETMEEFLRLWSLFYDNKIMIPTYGALFMDPNGDNPQADALLAAKFKALTSKGLICTDSQLMIPFEQKAYLQLFCPKEYVRLFCNELNRFEDIVAFWHNSPPAEDYIQGLIVTYDDYDSPSLAIPPGRNLRQRKMTGSAYTRLSSGTSDELKIIAEWLSDEMQDLLNPNTHTLVNITSPSFKTDPLYIFDVANQAWDALVVFLGFGMLIELGSVEEIATYLKLHGEEMDLGESIHGEHLHVLLFKSQKSLAAKSEILVLLLNYGLFSIKAYEWVVDPRHKFLKDTERAYFQKLLVPYLPSFYDPSEFLRRIARRRP